MHQSEDISPDANKCSSGDRRNEKSHDFSEFEELAHRMAFPVSAAVSHFMQTRKPAHFWNDIKNQRSSLELLCECLKLDGISDWLFMQFLF